MHRTLTDVSRDLFPALDAVFAQTPLHIGHCTTEDHIAQLLLIHGMLALLDTPDLRARATAVYFRTRQAWMALRSATAMRRIEEEAHIAGNLFTATADATLTEVLVPTTPYGPIALPPLLQQGAGIMALCAGETVASRQFLDDYRTATCVTCAIESCGG